MYTYVVRLPRQQQSQIVHIVKDLFKTDIWPRFHTHHKIPISNRHHIFFGILNNQICCTLTDFKPIWKVFNWHPSASELINGLIALRTKFICKCWKIFSITAGKAITILKPGWNLGPSDLLRRHSWVWLRGSISLWAGRLWKTRRGPLHRVGKIGEVWMGRWVVSIRHWKGRLRLCGGIGRRTMTVASGYIV